MRIQCQSKFFYFVSLSIAIIFILVKTSTATEQNDTLQTQPIVHRNIVAQMTHDFKYLSQQPSFYYTIGGIGFVPLVFHKGFDSEEPEITEQWGSSVGTDLIFEFGEIAGDGRFPLVIAGVSWGIGKMKGSSKLTSFGSDLFRVQAMNGIFTLGLKKSVDRSRPNGAPYSYPSGHTSSTFAFAGVVHKHFGSKYGIPAFLLAGYVGVSRLQEGKHYITDILAGGILGSYISLKLTNPIKSNDRFVIYPEISKESYKLAFAVNF